MRTTDLYHNDGLDEETKHILSIQTYYESMWIERGINIKYQKFCLPRTTKLQEPDIEIESVKNSLEHFYSNFCNYKYTEFGLQNQFKICGLFNLNFVCFLSILIKIQLKSYQKPIKRS